VSELADAPPADATRRSARLGGVEANELLTSSVAALLTILLLAEGATIIDLNGLLSAHMFIGLALIPPVLLKLASTGYRFARYYTGSPVYRAKGPPLMLLRVLAPILVASTAMIFATGVWLLLLGHHSDQVLMLHKVAFFVWAVSSACTSWPTSRAWAARSAPPGARARGGVPRPAHGSARPSSRSRSAPGSRWPSRCSRTSPGGTATGSDAGPRGVSPCAGRP
jgi:hypothetical protein